MGDFTLGCLLGQYDKTQSFDQSSVAITTGPVNSWNLIDPDTTSYYFSNSAGGFSTSTVHSSQQGLRLTVFGSGASATLMRYYYGYNNDAYQRWFPDVTTHDLRLDFRAGEAWASGSGDIRVILIGDLSASPQSLITLIPAENIQAFRSETTVRSNAVPWPRVDVEMLASTGSAQVVLDDVLLQVDPIALQPEWEFREVARQDRAQHRTQGGVLHTYKWSKHFAHSVPLRYLTNSHANLINWWWQNQFNLAFTLDTSDSESIRICRITNETQPIGSRVRPYNDLWSGVIQLESIDQGSLVF